MKNVVCASVRLNNGDELQVYGSVESPRLKVALVGLTGRWDIADLSILSALDFATGLQQAADELAKKREALDQVKPSLPPGRIITAAAAPRRRRPTSTQSH